MRRSFKSIWYAVMTNPISTSAIIGMIVALSLYLITDMTLFIYLLLLYLIVLAILERSIPKGWPAPLSRQLTPLFYGIRAPSGRWLIVQKRLPRSKDKDCRELLRYLTEQQRLLPKALLSMPGKYRAITHETVLRRIERMPDAVIESTRTVYKADMAATLNALTGGACKKCRKECPVKFGRQIRRQFYDVRFSICV